jgi:hypothetical protein
MGRYPGVRYAAGLFVITVGAILTFGVRARPDAVDIQAIGLILMLTGLAGLATARWLSGIRRRTDVIYRSDGVTLLEPNSPPPTNPDVGSETQSVGSEVERVERHIDSLPPDGPGLPPAPDLAPGAEVVSDPRTDQVRHVHGVMDAEPGTREFLKLQQDWE